MRQLFATLVIASVGSALFSTFAVAKPDKVDGVNGPDYFDDEQQPHFGPYGSPRCHDAGNVLTLLKQDLRLTQLLDDLL